MHAPRARAWGCTTSENFRCAHGHAPRARVSCWYGFSTDLVRLSPPCKEVQDRKNRLALHPWFCTVGHRLRTARYQSSAMFSSMCSVHACSERWGLPLALIPLPGIARSVSIYFYVNTMRTSRGRVAFLSWPGIRYRFGCALVPPAFGGGRIEDAPVSTRTSPSRRFLRSSRLAGHAQRIRSVRAGGHIAFVHGVIVLAWGNQSRVIARHWPAYMGSTHESSERP